MTRTLGTLALTLALTLPSLAAAQATVATPTGQTATEQRQRDQETRFQQAITQGRIDAREAAVLTQQMQRIQQYQERAYADGVLTLREQARLERFQDRYERLLANAIAR
ncbi:MAG: hypothetical protein U0234_05075 [Sandaracinus sp.]